MPAETAAETQTQAQTQTQRRLHAETAAETQSALRLYPQLRLCLPQGHRPRHHAPLLSLRTRPALPSLTATTAAAAAALSEDRIPPLCVAHIYINLTYIYM